MRWYSLGRILPFQFVSNENTLSDAAENSFAFLTPVTSRQSSGNSFTRCEAVMLFGSLDPLPRTLRLPLGSGLQWTLLFRVRSDKAGAFRASNADLVELDDPSLTLKGPSLILDDPLPIESAMWYIHIVQVPCWFQFNAHAQYTLHNISLYFTYYSCLVRVALLF